MSPGRLFCIVGRGGTGKDTVFRALLDDRALALRPVVPYTTRPRREFECEGREYHFVSEEALARLRADGRVVEERIYQTVRGTWRYATVDDGSLDFTASSYLMIATPQALAGLRARFGVQTVAPLYLIVEDGMLLRRMLRREKQREKPDYEELCRRFLADCRDFSPSALRTAGVADGIENHRLKDCLKEITARVRAQTGMNAGG